MNKRSLGLFFAGCIAATAAEAATPVALVEDVSGKPGVEFMDYLEPGKVITLGPKDSIVVSYLKSCQRETISGSGTVTVGAEQSTVAGGEVKRTKVACDGGKMELAAEQSKQSAAMVFRGAPAPKPQFTIFAQSPVVELPGGGTLSIERVDVAGERHSIALAPAKLVGGAFFDLAKSELRLQPGGIYRAKAGNQQLVFQVDAKAAEKGPLAGRLLRFQPVGRD